MAVLYLLHSLARPYRPTFLSPRYVLRLARPRLFIDSVCLSPPVAQTISLYIIGRSSLSFSLSLSPARSHPLSSLMDFLFLSLLGPCCSSILLLRLCYSMKQQHTRSHSCVHGASAWTGNLRIAGLTEKEALTPSSSSSYPPSPSPRADRFLWCFEILYARSARKLTVRIHRHPTFSSDRHASKSEFHPLFVRPLSVSRSALPDWK